MAVRASVNVSITPELDAFVQRLVASGRYHSASEVFREALRLLEQAERRRLLEKRLAEGLTREERGRLPAALLKRARGDLRQKIQAGLQALDRGDTVDGEEFFARWKSRLDAAAAPRRRRRAKRTA